MELLFDVGCLPFQVIRCPQLKLKLPRVHQPSPMTVFAFTFLSYFLVLSGMATVFPLHGALQPSHGNFSVLISTHLGELAFLTSAGVIYDIIIEPPSVGSTQEGGSIKPVAFLENRYAPTSFAQQNSILRRQRSNTSLQY